MKAQYWHKNKKDSVVEEAKEINGGLLFFTSNDSNAKAGGMWYDRK